MNKEELLQILSEKISIGEISQEEIMNRFGIVPEKKNSSSFSTTKMLYILGAAIVIVGIIIFVHQIWDTLGSFGRILITLGLGFFITATGSVLLKNKPESNLGTVFHFIGGVLIPGGALVMLSEINAVSVNYWFFAITFCILFFFYLFLNSIHKSYILTFFAIANGTAMIYLILNAITSEGWLVMKNIYQYLTMIIGISYLLLGYSFKKSFNKKLIGILFFFGITAFLGASFSQVFDSVYWQMSYFIIILISFLLAVYMRSSSILVMSTLFLIAHVSFITGKYFANSLGWPISLVILGFVFIGLGYISFNINKKYISN